MTQLSSEHSPAFNPVAAARRLAPRIVAARDETERLRRTPADLVKDIAAAGLYQMFLPRSAGGMEAPPLTAFEAIEVLSAADGSVGWSAMIATDVSLITGWLEPGVVREVAGNPLDLRAAGSLRPQGRARLVDGGYRVDGHWNFASGIGHANWLYAPCLVMDGEKPVMSAAGTPRVRAMWLPIEQARVVDNWSTLGLRGTGSHDFLVENVFVSASHSCFLGDPPVERGPLYNPRTALTYISAAVVANSLGIARGAIETLVEMAQHETSTRSTALLRDRPQVQAKVGEAEAVLKAARSYVIAAVGAAWDAVSAGEPDPTREVADARLAIVHGMREAVRAVDLVFHVAGTNAIHRRNALERHFRDIHVAVHHNVGSLHDYEQAGRGLMGLKATDPGW